MLLDSFQCCTLTSKLLLNTKCTKLTENIVWIWIVNISMSKHKKYFIVDKWKNEQNLKPAGCFIFLDLCNECSQLLMQCTKRQPVCPTGTYFNCIMFMVASSVVSTILILNYHHRNAETHEMTPFVSTHLTIWRFLEPPKKLSKPLPNMSKVRKFVGMYMIDCWLFHIETSLSCMSNSLSINTLLFDTLIKLQY